MIKQIVVGAGRNRTVVELPRDRETRRLLGNKIKSFLFPTNAAFQRAKSRGQQAKLIVGHNDNHDTVRSAAA